MIVPLPPRRQHEIEMPHDRSLPVDGGISAVSFQHESQSALRMTVGGCNFARQDELQAGIEIRCDAAELRACARGALVC